MNRHLIILAAALLLHTSSTQAQETAEHGGEEHTEAEAVTETDEASDSDEEEEEGDGPFFGVRMPVRDATLPQGTLALQWDLGLERSEADTTSDYFNLGIGYGVIDRLEVGATLTPLALGLFDTEFDYLDPSLYARYLIVRGDRELSFTVSGSIPTGEEDSEVGLALIGAIEIDDIVLEYGLEVEMELGDEVEVNYRLNGRRWQKDESSEAKYFLNAEAMSFRIVSGGGETMTERVSEPNDAFAEAGDDEAPF